MSLVTSLFLLTSIISAVVILIRDKEYFSKYVKLVPYIICTCSIINAGLAVYSDVERKNFETKSISLITGGDSYCYIQPFFNVNDKNNRFVKLWLENKTDLPCYDIQIRIVDLEKWYGLMGKGEDISNASRGAEKYLTFEALWNSKAMMLATIVLPNGVKHQSYNIFIDTRSGNFVELLRFQYITDKWEHAFQVRPLGKSEVLIERVSENFPRDKNGKALWDLYLDQLGVLTEK